MTKSNFLSTQSVAGAHVLIGWRHCKEMLTFCRIKLRLERVSPYNRVTIQTGFEHCVSRRRQLKYSVLKCSRYFFLGSKWGAEMFVGFLTGSLVFQLISVLTNETFDEYECMPQWIKAQVSHNSISFRWTGCYQQLDCLKGRVGWAASKTRLHISYYIISKGLGLAENSDELSPLTVGVQFCWCLLWWFPNKRTFTLL